MKLFSFKKIDTRYASGFTLVETMVAVSIFAIIVTVGIGALFSMNRSYSATRGQQAIIDQLNFAVEGMARKIRTGHSYYCGGNVFNATQDCPQGESVMAFTAVDGSEVSYGLMGSGRIAAVVDGDRFHVTPDSVTVTDLKFRVMGSRSADQDQPVVMITVVGNSEVRDVLTEFSIQTSVTQRLPDFQ